MISSAAFAVLVGVGASASVFDWRERRVPNRLVAIALLAAAAAVALQAAKSALGCRGLSVLGFGTMYLPWRWYAGLAVHAGLSLAAGWTLWRLGIWPAGDAKLYIALSALLPLVNGNLSGFPRLLFLVFLINAFVPAGLAFAAEASARLVLGAYSWARRGPRAVLLSAAAEADRLRVRAREVFAWRWRAAALAVNVVSLFFALQLLQRRLGSAGLDPLGRVALLLLMYALWDWAAPILTRPRVGAAALAAFCVAAWAAAAAGVDLARLLAQTARSVLGFSFLLMLARSLLHVPLEMASRARLPAGELCAGTILTEEAWAALAADPRTSGLLRERHCDGLSAEEAAALRAGLNANGGELAVRRAVPFAAWIMLGALLTLWRPGTVVSWLSPYARVVWAALTAVAGRFL
ncbi:MAG: hypothetical protein HKL90_06775 [Elusimicrobia bacterium]|nr:hypothetical protein [Elusimicrobiota bacterium]